MGPEDFFLKTLCAELLRSSPCHLSWRACNGTSGYWVMTTIFLLSLWFLTVVSIFQPYKLSATKDAIDFIQFYQVFKEFWVERRQLHILCCPRWSSHKGVGCFHASVGRMIHVVMNIPVVRPSSELGDAQNTSWVCHCLGGAGMSRQPLLVT